MPCMSYDDGIRTVVDQTTKQELDKYKRAFCELAEAYNNDSSNSFKSALARSTFLTDVYYEHSKEDEKRWFDFYKKKHKNFSKEEIAKMVRSGILERV